MAGREFRIGNVSLYIVKKDYSYLCMVDDIKLAGKKQNLDPMWKLLNKEVDLGEPTPFLDHVCWVALKENVKKNKNILDNYRNMFESRISAGAMENYQFPGNQMRIFPHGLMTWKVMQRSAWKDVVSWQTKQRNNHTKSQHHALTTTNSKKTKWDLLEICLKFAHRLF